MKRRASRFDERWAIQSWPDPSSWLHSRASINATQARIHDLPANEKRDGSDPPFGGPTSIPDCRNVDQKR